MKMVTLEKSTFSAINMINVQERALSTVTIQLVQLSVFHAFRLAMLSRSFSHSSTVKFIRLTLQTKQIAIHWLWSVPSQWSRIRSSWQQSAKLRLVIALTWLLRNTESQQSDWRFRCAKINSHSFQSIYSSVVISLDKLRICSSWINCSTKCAFICLIKRLLNHEYILQYDDCLLRDVSELISRFK